MAAVYLLGIEKMKTVLERGENGLDAEIQLIRMGELQFMGAPFEIMQAIKNDIVAASKVKYPMVMSLTNGSHGYAPDNTSLKGADRIVGSGREGNYESINHLDIIVDRLKREFNVECNKGKPQVAYRETITVAAECEGKYIKQSGGRGQYGHVWVKFEPNKDKGYEFVDAIVGGVVPREYIPVTDKGLQEAMAGGILAGYPMVDVKATLFDGSYHDVDSSEMAFKVAASLALKEAKAKCKPVLLEPIMKVVVDVPEEYMGNVMGDLTSRRGRPLGQESIGNTLRITALVPLSEMFGYATDLRSNTQGRGNFQMEKDHYDEVPKSIADEIIKKNSANA